MFSAKRLNKMDNLTEVNQAAHEMDRWRSAARSNGTKGKSSFHPSSFLSPECTMDPWHSTPVKQNTSLAPDDARRVSMSDIDRTSVKQTVGKARHLSQETSCHPILHDSNISVCEMDCATIQRQKREMQLLIAELKDRERELNAMATSHQRQLQVWEQDRQKILMLEQRCARLDDELHKRNEMIKVLTHRLQAMEATEKAVQQEFIVAQQLLHNLEQKHQLISQQCQDWEEKNQSLNSTVMALSSQVGSLQVKEEELSSMLKLKDKDVKEATAHIIELTGRLRDLETSLKESHSRESRLLREVEELKRRYRDTRHENTLNKEELQQHIAQSSSQREEIIRLKQELQVLCRDLAISGEGETWKDELLVLARSKQERTESEIHHLRQVCENQQNDLQLLQLNLESAQQAQKERNCHESRYREATGLLTTVDSEWNDSEQSQPWQVTGKGSGPKESCQKSKGHEESEGIILAESFSDTVTISDPMETFDISLGQTSVDLPGSSKDHIVSSNNTTNSWTSSQASDDCKNAQRLSCKYISIDSVTGKVNYHSSGYDSNSLSSFSWGSTDTEVESVINTTRKAGSADCSGKAEGQAMPSSVKSANHGCSNITEENAEPSPSKTTSYRCKDPSELPEPWQTQPYSNKRSIQGCVERKTMAPSFTETQEQCSTGTDCKTPVCPSSGGAGNQDVDKTSCDRFSHTDTVLKTEAGSNLVASLWRVNLVDISSRTQQTPNYTRQDKKKSGRLDDSFSSCRNSGHVVDVTSLLTTSQLAAASDDQGVSSANSKDGSCSFSNCCLQRLLDDAREMTARLERTNLRPSGSPQNSHTIIISQNKSLDCEPPQSPCQHTCQNNPHCIKCLDTSGHCTQPNVCPHHSSKRSSGHPDIH